MMRAAGVAFLCGAIGLLYVLFGYPLLLAVLSRREKPVIKRFQPRRVTLLLPVRNGARWLEEKLRSVLALDYPRELLQILVIANGCEDHTEQIATRFAPQGVRLVSLPRADKAEAINAGVALAEGEIVLFTDVRQALDPLSLQRLVACFADPHVGAASGELIIREGASQEEANVGLYWRYEKWIRVRQSRIDSVMGASGCLYAMRRELITALPAGTLLDDVYLPLAAFFRGYRVILETGARVYDEPASLNTEFRRKVRTLAGVYQVTAAYPGLLGPANRMWFHFLSHKLGRLLAPWCLLLIAVSSFFLPAPWWFPALALQACFYGLAVLDPCLPEDFPLKRVTAPVRAFVVLMASALCAAFVWVLPGRGLWPETRSSGSGTTR